MKGEIKVMLLWTKEHHIYLEKPKKVEKRQGTDSVIDSELSTLPNKENNGQICLLTSSSLRVELWASTLFNYLTMEKNNENDPRP